MQTMIAAQTGRLDRHVKRSFLKTSERTSRHRIAYALEEALRLTHLPREDEGRIYCFRRVSVCGISAQANRRVWIDAVQEVLAATATRAVHGNHPDALASDAIFFHNREEALEALLRHALMARSGIGTRTTPWYATSLLGVADEIGCDQQIVAALDLLRESSFSPRSAGILFAALDGFEPSLLLSAVPSDTFRDWIRQLEGKQDAPGDAPPLQLPTKLEIVLRQAAAEFSWKDPATVWLATQAVLCAAPNAQRLSLAVRRACSTLRRMEAEQRNQPKEPARRTAHGSQNSSPIESRDSAVSGRDPGIVFTDEFASPGVSGGISLAGPIDGVKNSAVSGRDPEIIFTDEFASPGVSGGISLAGPIDGVENAADSNKLLIAEAASKAAALGEITSSAGLFFLLNAIYQLGIVAAIDTCPALADADFVPHLLKQLSVRAGVADDDPIVGCLPPADAAFSLCENALANLQGKTECLPSAYLPPRQALDADRLLRIWVLAARRWCWRMSRLTIRDIVCRTGRVWLTRTDLDVTLPLEEVDIRIRRIGLDIDPGWIPWFGFVVRFHYVSRQPRVSSC